MATKIAYAIARESSDDRTLQNQYDNIYKVAKELGYKIIKEFGENVTGDATKKDGADPDFIEELRVAIRDRKPDAIFCYWIDRLTRTTFKQGAYLNEFSVLPKIPIYFTRENKWTIDPQTNLIDFKFLAELSSDTTPQKERENIKARTAPQREKNGAEGFYIGHLSDGYCVRERWGTYEDGHRRKIKEIIVDEDRRKVIEDIFSWYRKGYSIRKIADLLNSDNVLTTNAYRASTPEKFGHRQKYKGKDGIVRERRNAKWNGSLVSQILSNTWYKGERTYRGKKLNHQAIITKEEWQEVAAIREENKKSFRNKKESTKHTFLLSDLFFCGNCGRKMYGHFAGLNNHYYCSSLDYKQKCGLTGICKENVEAIIYNIISNKALNAAFGGTDDFIITDYFKLDKKKEKEIKENIANNNKIISKLESENDSLNKSIMHLAHLQGKCYNNPQLSEVYGAEINNNTAQIEDNKSKIVKYQIENKNLNHLLLSNSSIKEVLSNIMVHKELTMIKQLFKEAIDSVKLFNAEKRDDIVRIKFKNGIEAEFVYCARLLGNKYVLLEEPIHYDDSSQLIVSTIKPQYLVIDNNDLVFFRNTESNIDKERKLLPNTEIEETKCFNLEGGINLKDFIKMVRDTSIAIPFERLEEEPEIAKSQRVRDQYWRKKSNNGRPKGMEPYIIHNETYEEINLLRKRLYNKAYKIKNKKRLSEEEKKEKLAEIKRQLDVLTVQVPLIKPRKKRSSKKHNDDWEIATE